MNKLFKTLMTAGALAVPMIASADMINVDGGLGVYDPTYNVTWISDGNLYATMAASYSGGSSALITAIIAANGGSVIDPSGPIHTLSVNDFTASGTFTGLMNSFGSRAFVHYMDTINYGGTNAWSLPVVYGVNEHFNDSQLGQLYSEFTASPSSRSLFSNLGDRYWETQGISCSGAWQWIGADDCAPKTDYSGTLAVAPGEVPLPAAAWLLLSGFGGLGFAARSRGTTGQHTR
jgi:hypothetical protein